jgi:CBS domain-containing membrane protein
LALRDAGRIAEVMSEARTAAVDDPAVGLVPALTDGRTHAIFVTSADRTVLGVITGAPSTLRSASSARPSP